MARRKRAESRFEGGAPVELTDAQHPVWSTVESTQAWLHRLGMKPDRRLAWGPANRCDMAGLLWALSAGVTRDVSWSTQAQPDLGRLRSLGVRGGFGGGEATAERFAYAGVALHR